MKSNKRPVFIVAGILLVLIAVPIIALLVLKKDNISEAISRNSERREVVIDFETRQLVEKAKQLVNKDLAAALRRGDVQIDFMSVLQDDLVKADKKLSDGKIDQAKIDFTDIVTTAEGKLEMIKFATSARKLKDSAYAELGDHEYLKAAFENTYNEAVAVYNQGLQDLEAGDFEKSINNFESANTILKELKTQSVEQVKAKLEAAEVALSSLDPASAKSAFARVLEIDPSNSTALTGMLKVEALEEFASAMKSVKSLRSFGENEAALAEVNELIEKNPGNSLLLNEKKAIEADIIEEQRNAVLERADAAEAQGDLIAAIEALEEANKIRSDEETTIQLNQLRAKEKEKRVETFLETGYNALKAGNYEAAKTAYEEAIALNPKSEEAQSGLKKTSSLQLANIRYNKSIESAANYLNEGRIPLATKFFNEALESRPSHLTFKQKDEESRIRNALEELKAPVNVLIVSDRRTYVSLIGVFPPERFKEKELTLYPDVYKFKGTRKNYLPVEVEVKVDNKIEPGGIEVICTDKL
jgi:tetratricopeptide (TPR) repeat protein